MADQTMTAELRVGSDPRSDILGHVAQWRARLDKHDRELLDEAAHRYKLKLAELIGHERDHTKARAGLERLIELVVGAGLKRVAPLVLDEAELGSAVERGVRGAIDDVAEGRTTRFTDGQGLPVTMLEGTR